MRELVEEYAKVRKDVMIAWTTAQAVEERDLSAEMEQLLDERALIREVLVAGARELAAPKAAGEVHPNAHTCPICFENQSDVAFVPCGHTVCNKCADKLSPLPPVSSPPSAMKCPTCRRAVTRHIKLFF